MTVAKRIMIVQLTGASPDELDVEALNVIEQLKATSGLERISRYRKLNDSLSIVLAEYEEGAGPLDAVPLELIHPGVASKVVTATEQGSRRREDAGNEPRDVPLLYSVCIPVPDDRENALAKWYDEEHMEMLQRSSFWSMTRRFRIEPGAPAAWQGHMALHYLNDIGALRSPERHYARNTPWRLELGSEPWFKGNYNVFLQELPH